MLVNYKFLTKEQMFLTLFKLESGNSSSSTQTLLISDDGAQWSLFLILTSERLDHLLIFSVHSEVGTNYFMFGTKS